MKAPAMISVAVAVTVLLSVGTLYVLTNDDGDSRPVIYTSMGWQKEIAEEVAGDGYRVVSFIEPGGTPHAVEVSAQKIALSSNAVAYFYIGAGMAWEDRNLESVKAGIKSYNCTEGAGIELLHGHTHAEDGSVVEDPAALDGHVWTSPENLKKIAGYMKDVLGDEIPEDKEKFESGYGSFAAKCDALTELADEKLKQTEEKEIIGWHAGWSYLLHGRNIVQHSLELPGETMTPASWIELRGECAESSEPVPIYLRYAGEGGITEEALKKNGINAELFYINPLSVDILGEIEKAIDTISENMNGA